MENNYIFRLLLDAVFSWQTGKLLYGLKTLPIFWDFAVSKHSLSLNKYNFNSYEFLKVMFLHFCIPQENSKTYLCFYWFPAAIFVPLKQTLTWRLHTKIYKFGYTLLRISCVWNIPQTWFLARLFEFNFFHFPVSSGMTMKQRIII